MKSRLLLVGLVSLLPLCAFPQTVSKILKLKNGKGTASGEIKGYAIHDYAVFLTQGKKVSVKLTNRDGKVFFNFMPKGAKTAVFNGSINGNSFSAVVPKDGTYIVSVYQMRVTARRPGSHKYQVAVQLR